MPNSTNNSNLDSKVYVTFDVEFDTSDLTIDEFSNLDAETAPIFAEIEKLIEKANEMFRAEIAKRN